MPHRNQFAFLFLTLIGWVAIATSCSAQLPVFPGAEGFGGTFGGTAPANGWFSNASIYHVTTTADTINATTGKPDFGTLRGAFYDYTNPNSPKQGVNNRVVVFDVGGAFNLTQGSLDIKTVNNLYVAGQTAPSPVTVYGDTTQITKSNNTMTSNVALRYLTFRKGAGNGEDAITFSGGSGAAHTVASNLILDHVSASWAEDENLSVANNNTNVTVQYSIIADALVSNHAYGSLIRPQIDSNVTFHHNLYANNSSRQARFGTYNGETLTADFRNNVIYNWRDRASYTGGSSEAEQEQTDVNYVGNYLVAGAGTLSNANKAYSVDKNVDTRVYQSGNFIDSDKGVNPSGVPNGSDLGWSAFQLNTVTDQTFTQMPTPFATAPVTTQTAGNAYNQVLSHVGNHWWQREAIDARIITNVLTNTGPPGGIGAAAPGAAELAALLATPTTTRAAGYDSDNDGMPNSWEVAHGLNPNLASDALTDFDADSYPNIVEYINDAGAFPAPTPIKFVGTGSARYALTTNWRTDDGGVTTGSNWQPSWYDSANIASGTVTVDAVGQHAKNLTLGLAAADAPQLTVSNGWLKVADTLQIGAHASSAAQLNLTGGELTVESLQKGTAGNFSMTGGELHAAQVGFSLTNNGGRVAPGNSVGATAVTGNLTLASGTLEIELASAMSFDQVSATGALALGGALDVLPLNGYAPTTGSWLIATAGSVTGSFSSVTSGYSVRVSGGNVFLDFGSLPGDFNSDGQVDAADYTVWRDTQSISNPGGYAVWAANFGAGSSASTPSTSAVPEPGALFVALAAGALLGLFHKIPPIVARLGGGH